MYYEVRDMNKSSRVTGRMKLPMHVHLDVGDEVKVLLKDPKHPNEHIPLLMGKWPPRKLVLLCEETNLSNLRRMPGFKEEK